MRLKVAALFVDPKGPYPQIPGVDCWDKARDARKYPGSLPVVAHPPCGRWCGMAKLNERRWGAKVGEDGGCFASALESVRKWGGVLEHPAGSLAWARHGLYEPTGAAWTSSFFRPNAWVCEVWQSAYGHKARKRTWLLYVGETSPEPLRWNTPRGTHQVGGGINTGNRSLPRLDDRETHLSPMHFAEALVALALGAR